MAKKEELKELDLGVINEIIEANSAPDAKAKIQAYAKECGFKLSKSNISVDDMVTKLLEMADAKENEKLESSPMDKIKTPEVSVDVKSIDGDEELSLAEDVDEFDKLDLKPGEIVPINDLPEKIKTEIFEAIESGSVTISAPTTPIEDSMLNDGVVKHIKIMDGQVDLTAIEPVGHVKISGDDIVSNAPSDIAQDVKIVPVGADLSKLIEDQEKIIGDNINRGQPTAVMMVPVGDEPDMSGFTPRINLIGAVGQQYMNCPYWILDWILENGREWKTKIHTHPRPTDHPLLQTVLYYIQIHGSVTVRESRNSRFHTLY